MQLSAALRAAARSAGAHRTAVVGNEAADLDSIASAIVLSASITHKSNARHSALPFIACKHNELRLRPDAHWMLKSLGLISEASSESICFADDAASNCGKFDDAILVDCNGHSDIVSALSLQHAVVQVVDHHADDGVQHFGGKCAKQIDTVGSCSTLVAERALLLDEEFVTSVSELLLAAIVMDTQNLSCADRTTARDVKAAYILDRHAANCSFRVCNSMQTLYETLKEKRFSQDHFTTMELLHKDYKQFTMGNQVHVGIASISLPLKRLIARQQLVSDVISCMHSKQLDMLIIMSAYETTDGQFVREAAMCCTNTAAGESYIHQAEEALHSNGMLLNAEKELSRLHEHHLGQSIFPNTYLWTAVGLHPATSRKKLQPGIQERFDAAT